MPYTNDIALVTGVPTNDDNPYFVALLEDDLRTAFIRRDVYHRGPQINFGDLIKVTYMDDFTICEYSIVQKDPFHSRPNSKILQCRVLASRAMGHLTMEHDILGLFEACDQCKDIQPGYYQVNFSIIRHPSEKNCSKLVIQKLLDETPFVNPVVEQPEKYVKEVGIIVQCSDWKPQKQGNTMRMLYIWTNGSPSGCDGTAIEYRDEQLDSYNFGDIVVYEATEREYEKRLSSSFHIKRLRKLDPMSEECKKLGYTVHVTNDNILQIEIRDLFVGENDTAGKVEIPQVGSVLTCNKIQPFTWYDSIKMHKVYKRDLPGAWKVSEATTNTKRTSLVHALQDVFSHETLANLIEAKCNAAFKFLKFYAETGYFR